MLTPIGFTGFCVRFLIMSGGIRRDKSYLGVVDCALMIAFLGCFLNHCILTQKGDWVEIFWNCLVLT